MRLSSITAIILRLFGLYWLASALLSFIAIIGIFSSSMALGGWSWTTGFQTVSPFLTPLAYLILGLTTWLAGSKIAEKITREVDAELEVGTITAANLYSLGILVVGLYFFLSHLGGSLGWLHYLAVNQAGDALMEGEDGLSIYEVIDQIVPCAGGLYFALLSERFGARLAAKS